jgi:biopolymer transport protein ExbD
MVTKAFRHSTKRMQPMGNFSHFSIVLALVLLTTLCGIGNILVLAVLRVPTIRPPSFQHQFASTSAQRGAIVVSLTRDNKLYLNNSDVAIDELLPKVLALGNKAGGAPVYLAVDKRVPYGRMLEVCDRLHTHSGEVISLVVSGRDIFDSRIVVTV